MIDIKDSDSIKKNISPFHFVYLLSGPEKSVKTFREKIKGTTEAGRERGCREVEGVDCSVWK